jgi:hypothetical protein
MTKDVADELTEIATNAPMSAGTRTRLHALANRLYNAHEPTRDPPGEWTDGGKTWEPAPESSEDALVAAARVALDEMCRTNAPRVSFTDAVNRLDAALAGVKPPARQTTMAQDIAAQIEAGGTGPDWHK